MISAFSNLFPLLNILDLVGGVGTVASFRKSDRIQVVLARAFKGFTRLHALDKMPLQIEEAAAHSCAKIGFGIDSRLPVFWGV